MDTPETKEFPDRIQLEGPHPSNFWEPVPLLDQILTETTHPVSQTNC